MPFGGSKREISSGAPKWAIQVKVLLSDLLKLIKVEFHSLGGGPDPPCVTSLASPHRPEASVGASDSPRRVLFRSQSGNIR